MRFSRQGICLGADCPHGSGVPWLQRARPLLPTHRGEGEGGEEEERPGRGLGDDGEEAGGGVEFDRHTACVEIQEGACVAAGDVEDRRAIAVFTSSTAACN